MLNAVTCARLTNIFPSAREESFIFRNRPLDFLPAQDGVWIGEQTSRPRDSVEGFIVHVTLEGVVGGKEAREEEVDEDEDGEGSDDEEESTAWLDDGADGRVEDSEEHGTGINKDGD
jgi:hypothetical protein